jgi:hypothetical protein
LKLYNAEIHLENKNGVLRAGMSCKAEIIVEQHIEATYIPLQAVLRVGGQPTVYVLKDGKLEDREVEIGLDNNRVIRIIQGLEPGERVTLTPPLAAAAIEPSEYSKDITLDMIPTDKGKELMAGSRRETTEGEPGAGNAEAEHSENLSLEEHLMRQILENLVPEEKDRFSVMSYEGKRKFLLQRWNQQVNMQGDL